MKNKTGEKRRSLRRLRLSQLPSPNQPSAPLTRYFLCLRAMHAKVLPQVPYSRPTTYCVIRRIHMVNDHMVNDSSASAKLLAGEREHERHRWGAGGKTT